MRLAVTGATGLVGRFIVEEALGQGDAVIVLGRRPPPQGFFTAPVDFHPFDLAADDAPDLSGCDALVHAALSHVPGRYRGGEGDDPDGFAATNLDGLDRLIASAQEAEIARVVFLSSRAVYGPQPPGLRLTEQTPCNPDTLYGRVKLQGELALAESGLHAVSLRATGVYGPAGPGRRHKWADLFDAFAAGKPIAPRIGTEVHGADLAQAARLALTTLGPGAWNVSDILLDRHDLLSLWSDIAGVRGRLPDPVPDETRRAFNVPDTDCIDREGWRPGGLDRLQDSLREMA